MISLERNYLRSAAALLLMSAAALPLRSDDNLPDTNTPSDLNGVKEEAENLLRGSFSKFKFYSVKPSVVDGLYEIDTGANMVYFNPDAKAGISDATYYTYGRLFRCKVSIVIALQSGRSVGCCPSTLQASMRG